MRAEEFVSEKWSEKYKRSVDCNNPKGFSQRAHCAGRKKNEDIDEAGNPQMVARRITAPGVSTVDYSAPWVQSRMQQARQRKKSFDELSTGREKFDFLYNLKSGKTTNTIKIQGPAGRYAGAALTLNIENYNPATGDIELVGYMSQGRSGSQELRFRANTDTFNYRGRMKKGVSGGYNYYFSPGNSLEFVSQQAKTKPADEPVAAAPSKPSSPWDILNKTKLKEEGDEQLDELSFKGSPCTKDCSGHRAGYEWSQRKGGVQAASWSRSFNNGAAIAAAGL